jgi:hypothetical protein
MKIEEVLSYVGLKTEDVKDLDTFKAQFDQKFVNVEAAGEHPIIKEKIIGAAVGKTIGSIETEMNRVAKQFAIEFNDEEKKKPLTERMSLIPAKLAESYNKVTAELEDKLKLSGDEATKKYVGEIEKLKTDNKTFKEMVDKTKQTYEEMLKQKEAEHNGLFISHTMSEAKKKLKFVENPDPYKLKGFEATFNEKYKLELDENRSVIVRNAKGERIPNPKKAGDFMDLESILATEAEQAGLINVNGQKNVAKSNFVVNLQNQNQPSGGGDKSRRVVNTFGR